MKKLKIQNEIVPLLIILTGILLIISPVVLNKDIIVRNTEDFYLYNAYFTSPKITIKQ